MRAKLDPRDQIPTSSHDNEQVNKPNAVGEEHHLGIRGFVRFHCLLLDIPDNRITDQSQGDHQHTVRIKIR